MRLPTHKNDVTCIVGPQTIQNQLLADFIASNLGLQCSVEKSLPFVSSGAAAENIVLLLVDCNGMDAGEIEKRIEGITSASGNAIPAALFNVGNQHKHQIEERAIQKRIDGVFFENTPLPLFKKGIQSILAGDQWFSRKSLLQIIRREDAPEPELASFRPPLLTKREVEILRILTTGASNDQIARHLHISRHTVKTHVYNIFRKIEVDNRFQASAWFSKYYQ